MEDCKYRLPCGRCDKYDRDCDASKLHKCNHEWRLAGYGVSKNDGDIVKYFYYCRKCDAKFESNYKFNPKEIKV